MADLHKDKILILDFGSQYTQLIARRIRECGVYCEIMSCDASDSSISEFAASGIVLSGGPESTTAVKSPQIPHLLFSFGVPVLGICYGMQAMALQLGGRVVNAGKSEFGYASITINEACDLFSGLADSTNDDGSAVLDVWMSHGDHVEQVPAGFTALASSTSAPIVAMQDAQRRFYGVQFHPEVTHTKQGLEIIRRFVIEICQCDALWTASNIVDDAIHTIRSAVGQDEVLLALSGGVDSSVVATLLQKAIGDQLTCVFVDNGLLRLNEGDQVMRTFAENLGVRVIRINAEARFITALQKVVDPEEKRRIIGNLFIEIFEEEAAKLTTAKWLAQGTIYPDVIESAGADTAKAHVIKSHHNVGGLPEDMSLELIEPLRELFKDEVRQVGVQLGLPESMVYRHPFPGPGLGVRILGEVKKEYTDILRRVDDIFIGSLVASDFYNKVSQAFAVFLPVKSVGVTGDGRRYGYVVSLRAVETVDFMTAQAAQLPFEFLDEVSRRIINNVPEVSRVTYDISSKPPATIEWE